MSTAEQPKPSLPPWWVALVALIVSLGTTLATYSRQDGAREQELVSMQKQLDANTKATADLKAAYEADKARRAAEAEAKVADFERERAQKMARLEAIAERLQELPPTKR
ncbi:hypothetical protein [Hymenobacter sp. 102]|uniref:hypothetical protein n=1 Tax=Hymenobacter sp. 102 TaxID=3403152 RepID=UPI003CEE07A6